jgi:hypothetical protein
MTRAFAICLLLGFAGLLAGMPLQAGMVISQVYGGGGNAGAQYENDFIELFNPGPQAVNLTGWSVQYASAIGSSWIATPLSGSLQAGHFYLVAEATGGANGDGLPLGDASGSLNLSSSTGKVALVSTSMALSGNCPLVASVVDFVGYGGADCSEGSASAAALSNTTAATRINPCLDTDDNAADFSSASAPAPRNSSLAATACAQLIGYAVLQFPYMAMLATACPTAGESMLVFGQVYVAGATDAASLPAAGMVAQLGVFVDGADPAVAPAASWATAIANPGFDFGANNDEYEAYLSMHASGIFDYAYRFAYANGPFVYADTGMGSSDGYSPANAGQLIVTGDVIYCDRFDTLSP